jgi:hypothetical protein
MEPWKSNLLKQRLLYREDFVGVVKPMNQWSSKLQDEAT